MQSDRDHVMDFAIERFERRPKSASGILLLGIFDLKSTIIIVRERSSSLIRSPVYVSHIRSWVSLFVHSSGIPNE